MKQINQILAKFYVIATLVIMPFYVENGYFNTLDAKSHVFWAASGVLMGAWAVLGIVVLVMRFITGDDKKPTKRRKDQGKAAPKTLGGNPFEFSLMDIAVIAFAAVSVISWLLSEYGVYALTGEQGWNIGAWTIVALAFTYFFISRCYTHDKYLWVYIIAACLVLYLLGFLNGLDIDPLAMHTKLTEKEHFEYIATIGNINSYSGYLSLTVPVVTFAFITDDRRWLVIPAGCAVFLGMTNLIVDNSDGAFLGAGAGLLFLVYYCLKDKRLYAKLFLAGLIMGAACALMGLIVAVHGDAMAKLSGVAGMCTEPRVFCPGIALCLVALVLSRKFADRAGERFTRTVSVVFAVIVLVGIAAGIIYTAMHFSGKWGTKRGWIWGFAIEVFSQGSFKNKLVGVGPECFGIPVMEQFSEFISEHWGKRIANAHNEYLQYLVTMGILGMISYIMLYLSSFIAYLKRKNWNVTRAAMFFAIMGYMAQAAVNNPQALNMATLFLFMGIYRSYEIKDLYAADDRKI